jgi:hypothetical protein
MQAERITLTPIDGGNTWRAAAEGGDVEGHSISGLGLSIEPAGEQDGEPVYRVSAGEEDVEGQAFMHSDERLKHAIAPLTSPLQALKALGGEDA